MKITFLVSGTIRSNFSYRALSLAESLVELGNNVSIIAPRADKYNNFTPEIITSIKGVRILQPYQFATRRIELNLIPYIFGAIYFLLKEKPEVVYIYKATPISIVGLLAKLFRKTLVLTDFDDLGSEVMRLEGHPVYQRMLVKFSEDLAATHSDRLIVASSYLSNHYQNQFPSKKIFILPNCVTNDWFTPALQTSFEKRIVFMGSINRKDILEPLFDVLPELLKIHPEVKVEIIGDGQALSYFKQKAFNDGLTESVFFTGWLHLNDARSRLHFGDVGYCFMPNDRTVQAASNMKVPQYMSRGTVPFVSAVGDLPLMVDFGKAGYVCESNDRDSLKSKLSEALTDTNILDKAAHARERANQSYSCSAETKNFIEWLGFQKPTAAKKIYYIATTVPDDVGGAEMRNYNILKQLTSKSDMDVEVFCITSKDPVQEAEKFTAAINAKIQIVPDVKRSILTLFQAIILERLPPFMTERKLANLGHMLRNACEKSLPDIVFIEQLDGYYCIRPHIRWLRSKGVKIVFDCHNVEFQAFRDSLAILNPFMRFVGKYTLPRMKYLEIEASRSSDLIFACSDLDAAVFSRINSSVHVLPNAIDSSVYKISKEHKENILIFIGGTKYPPNADGIEFYLKRIHPQVIYTVPDVKLLLIGVDAEWLSKKGIDATGIEPLGFVPEVQPYLDKAAIGICPIRQGSGTRIKIMTYMAAGLAVVSTTKGAEGVEYVNGKHAYITDNPSEFAHDVIQLLEDKKLQTTLAENGRSFIVEHYDWNSVGNKLVSLVNMV